ncbi:MAG: OB-fold domain-containing protein [Thauera sp.]|nr:OB-fold domain-containing protein [Thauera sp.]
MKDVNQDVTPEAPVDDDFLAGLERGELLYPRCADCNAALPFGAASCLHCGSAHLKWVASAGEGSLQSYVIYHRSYVPGVEAPYAVGLFQLEEGPRLLARLDLSGQDRFVRGGEFAARVQDGQLTFG